MQCEVLAMGLTRLGNFIEQTDIRNDDSTFGENDVKGISTTKQFIETKADLLGVSLKSYKVIRPNEFVYVADTSRRGDKIGLAYCENKPCIVSSIYTSFKVKDESKLLPRFLMMYFNRSEFDRYARFNSWGSARETFTWEDMRDIEINLPPIEIQRKYVAIYEGLLANLHSYENKLEELKLVCDGYIEDLRKKYPSNLCGCLVASDERNILSNAKLEMGVSIEKIFIPTKANSSDVSNQKIVYPGQFAFNSNTSRNSDTISIAFNNSNENYAVSNTYVVFKCIDSINPKFLKLWFNRDEFNRFARFNSWGSARETIGLTDIEAYEIGLPPLEIQNSIVEVFNVYNERKEYVTRLKNIIKDICPILVRGAIKEASEVK